MNGMNIRNPIKVITVLLTLFIGVAATPIIANECSTYAKSLSNSWYWHYPREAPNSRTGKRDLRCKNNDFGYLYTSDRWPGQYFVTNSAYVRKTKLYPNICSAVAEYCSRNKSGWAGTITGDKPPSNSNIPKKPIYCSLGKASWIYDPKIEYYVFRSYKLTPHHSTQLRRQYKIFGDYGGNKYQQRAQKIQSGGKMEFIMKAPLMHLCSHLRHNCNTSEPFATQLCGRLDEHAVLPDSAYFGR